MKKAKRIAIVVILLAGIHSFGMAAERWQSFTHGDHVRAIAERDDEIWIATNGGLVQMDRSTGMKTVHTKTNTESTQFTPALPSNVITSLDVDLDGRLWIGTEGGLNIFHNGTWELYTHENSPLPVPIIRGLMCDSRGNTWIQAHPDVFTGVEEFGVVRHSAGEWTIYTTQNSDIPFDMAMPQTEGPDGAIWFTGFAGLVRFDGQVWTHFTPENSGLPSMLTYDCEFDAEGNLWVGTLDGLARFDGVDWRVYSSRNSPLRSDDVRVVSVDHNGFVWCGAIEGLYRFNGADDWEYFTTEDSGLPQGIFNEEGLKNEIRALHVDDDNYMWIGTNAGVARYRNQTGDERDKAAWDVFGTSNSGAPSQQLISSLLHDGKNVWMSSWAGGFSAYNQTDDAWTRFGRWNGLASNWIDALVMDKFGDLWIGVSPGALIRYSQPLSGEAPDFTEYNSDNSDFPVVDNIRPAVIWDLATDSRGNIWIATEGAGVARLGGRDCECSGEWSAYTTANSNIPSDIVWTIEIDANDQVWIGGDAGLARLVDDDWETIMPLTPSADIHSIAFDRDGAVWFSTLTILINSELKPGGLIRLKDGVQTLYNSSHSQTLPVDDFDPIMIDRDGVIWAGASSGAFSVGLMQFDPQTEAFSMYDFATSGLPSNAVTALLQTPDGAIWIGTIGGGVATLRTEITDVHDDPPSMNYGAIERIRVAPNPASGPIAIMYDVTAPTFATIRIFDAFGREALPPLSAFYAPGSYVREIDAAKLSAGAYFCSIASGDQQRVTTFHIMR